MRNEETVKKGDSRKGASPFALGRAATLLNQSARLNETKSNVIKHTAEMKKFDKMDQRTIQFNVKI